jgi:hypothetical protein
MYETHLQDEHFNRQVKLVYFITIGVAIILFFFFMVSNHLTKYLLHFWLLVFLVWGACFGYFIFSWRLDLRYKELKDLFPDEKEWYAVKPKRHTGRRLSNRKYYVLRNGTTLQIRTEYFWEDGFKDTITTIDYATFMSNYVLMEEKTAQ